MLRLEAERLRQGISKSELARRSGLNAVTVIEATNGKRTPGSIQLERLAAGLGWAGDSHALLNEVDQP